MKLAKFFVDHYGCLYSVSEIPFQPITVFIGQNDGGKTATQDAVELFFGRGAFPTELDYSLIPPDQVIAHLSQSEAWMPDHSGPDSGPA